jgi:hypothetical protein
MNPGHIRYSRSLALSAAAAAFMVLVLASLQAQGPPVDGGLGASEISKIQIGFALAPVPLDLQGKNPALVGLGSYLVATHACSDCHTSPPFEPGGNPFLGQPEQVNTEGYLAGGVAFGPFITRNITPDRDGRPARLTLEEFLLVMQTGADLKNRPPFVPSEENDLLQVMPWPWFKDMTEYELTAMYEYLRAVPCIGSVSRCGE